MDNFNDWMIQPKSQCINLLDTIKLILNFNEDQLDLVWCNSIKKQVSNFNKGETLKIINHFM